MTSAITSPFDIGESVSLAFDDQRRLRIMVPRELLPVAAWLYTDAQPNIAVLDRLGATLQRCRSEERTLVGNGCQVDFVNNIVVLESRYGRWPRKIVPQSVFWPVLNGLRSFLVAAAADPALARPADYPLAVPRIFEERPDGGQKPYFVDYTYFPPEWSGEEVRAAGNGAWQSPTAVRDLETGVWSGMWRGLELAGYFDPATGEVLTFFPVIAP
ncbi:EndoU domain-containing protein [Amycolatopsis carbonis]|uniref:EndoU domain-containing protein n=1 Tax=Amycolatopsis carbonis TaxID=715471 RepID=A0A9Y2IPG5_9PSEU|nr:EndoU domain-containing protein [Amycolatopsis sp. 2-15]WIX83011.1 EndoU domain-containing protein [Amycolatopsis sp. 2-15]